MFFHGLQNYFTEKFASVFPKISSSCVKYVCLSDPSAFHLRRGITEGQRVDAARRWEVSGPLSQHSLTRREYFQHSPTLSLICHHMSRCPVPHTPAILALISPVPADVLEDTDIAELEFQKFRNKGCGWCARMVYGLRDWVGRLGWGSNPGETALQRQCRSAISSYSNLVKPQLLLLLMPKNKITPPPPVP